LLEAYENGVVWSVPLGNGLRNVTLLVDWDQGRRIRELSARAFYLSEVERLNHVARFLSGASFSGMPRVWDATLYTSRTFAGSRFLLAGDAGLFIDPLSSEGVQTAMASAVSGAAVISTILQRPTVANNAIAFYSDAQSNAYLTHYHQSAEYYGQERRWPHSAFWQKRRRLFAAAKTNGDAASARLKPPSEVSHVALAQDARLERRPVLEWPWVETREVLVSARHPRGVRFLHKVSIPALIKEIRKHPAVVDVLNGYLNRSEGRGVDSGMVRAALVALYREGVLIAIEPHENRSGSL
jgi:hypothetical protein